MKTAKLGTDIKGNLWEVETEQTTFQKGKRVFYFWAYPVHSPKRRNHPTATAEVIIESDTVAKLKYIGVDEPKGRLHIGSLLLNFVEQSMAHMGIKVVYGDISKDTGLYSPYFNSLKSYLVALEKFYRKHGWTWQLFGGHKPISATNSYAIGRVEKQIGFLFSGCT